MPKKSVVVIGAGISGLSASIYLLQQGFKVTLLEKNSSVGGLCTGWYRHGKYIDGCIHWLSGTKENHLCYNTWKDIGGFESQDDLIYLDTWGDFTYNGQVVRFLRDYKKAEKQWLAIAPEDKKEIHKFFHMVEDFMAVNLPMDMPTSMLPLSTLIKTGFNVVGHPSFLWTMHMGTDEYAKRFKNSAIRWAMEHAQVGPGNLFSMLFSYATIASNSGGVPVGGSKAFVERIKNRFLSLGGELILQADVEQINTQNGYAKEVILKNGQIYKGDYFVASLDPNFTLEKLLENKYKVPAIQKRKNNYQKYPTVTTILITYEIEDISHNGQIVTFPCQDLDILGTTINYLDIRNYSYDAKTFVHGNKTICHTQIHLFDDDYFKWEKLYQDKTLYQQTKSRIAHEVVDRIVKQYPQYKEKIKILDVFTPMTLKHYTNVTRGAYMSLFTKNKFKLSHNGKIKGLYNVYLASQWLETPGGLPYAAVVGRYAAIRICKQERIKFSGKNKIYLYKNIETY